MAITQKEIILRYLWKFIGEINNGKEGEKTIEDLYNFIRIPTTDQKAEVKAWAVPYLQERRDARQTKSDNAAAQLAEMDADITEANNL